MRFGLSSFVALLFLSAAAQGHGYGSTGDRALDWKTDQVRRTVALNNNVDAGDVVPLNGKRCLEGSGFAFDVDDRYAFDIDEPVELEVEFYRQAHDVQVDVSYEPNADAKATRSAQIPAYRAGDRAYEQAFTLDRARFANRGRSATDFSIGVGRDSAKSDPTAKVVVCNVRLKRSHATVIPTSYGRIALQVLDESGKPVPARVGIYDTTGRLPLPSSDAVAVKKTDDAARVFDINPNFLTWPARNPSGFYVNGSYQAKLPVGEYQLIVARGMEYRFVQQNFKVESDRTQVLKVNLQRWDDLPAKGWYSGDTHVHYVRTRKSDDPNLLLSAQAEDVHVTNVLQAGNIARPFFVTYDWQPVFVASDPTYAIVPGQEDPRTKRRGHTLSLHLKEPVRDPQHYLLYHDIFEKTRAQGAVTGYAHAVGKDLFNARAGLALDVPIGLVDFVEVLQFGMGGSQVWFDFLNLGYKLAPGAGTDHVSDFNLIGAERTYVHVQRPFTLQAWFDGLKRGETFVTNGPMLEMTVNGQTIGSELQLKAGDTLTIDAAASINPDIDFLDSLELIEQGEVIETVKAEHAAQTELRLHYQTTARHGTWFVVRARGKRLQPNPVMAAWETHQGSAKIAISGATYVFVDGQSFWKPAAVPAIVQRFKQAMQNLMAPETGDEVETWETREPTLRLWDSQKPLLEQRIAEVTPTYERLLAQAEAIHPSGAARCEALRREDFTSIPDATSRITAAGLTKSDQTGVSYCEVAGYVAPRIEFLLRLPSDRWNGKFVELGCGGPCGTLAYVSGCETPLRRGYACIVSDGGHKVESSEPMKWAQGNPQAAVEYFSRASHVTALAGKSIVRSYYGQDARKSYFMGCSAGGVQAMWLAQKFPWDFDGIVAGGPALSLSRIWLNWLWANRALVGADGKAILEPADLQTLHRAAVRKCDLTDGVQDGVIGDPRSCRFTPSELQCAGGKRDGCLTAEQVAAAAKIYEGPVNSRGERVAAPIAVVGSELAWSGLFTGSETHPTDWYTYLRAWPRYSTFELNLGPSWKPADFNFDSDYKRLGAMEALEPMFHPDLRRLRAEGAKLIVYTGWNDAIEGVHNTTEYYETAEKIVGSRAATQEFFRLFVVPGMNHCAGGDGASRIDWLSHIEDWVENGRAPDAIPGAHIKSNDLDLTVEKDRLELARRGTFPLRPENIVFTRQVYPYPDVAKYLGRGDPNDGSNFGRVRSR